MGFDKNNYYTVKELAEKAGVCTKTIQRLKDNDDMVVELDGRKMLIQKEAADKWLESRADKPIRGRKKLDAGKLLKVMNDKSTKSDKGKNDTTKNHDCEQLCLQLSAEENHNLDRSFNKQLATAGFEVDEKGLYVNGQKGKVYISSFTEIEYLYNWQNANNKIRVIRFGDAIIDIYPKDLLNSTNLRTRLLSSSNYTLNVTREQYEVLINMILSMDNGKYIEDAPGFGKIVDGIYNLGNMIIVNSELNDFKDTIWLGSKGYCLSKTDMISINPNPLQLSEIWDSFYELYGMQAVLILGYATATLFFQQYMEAQKHFPLFYIQAGSGRGKSGLSELIMCLFGIKEPLADVNCASNSTKIGIESKAGLLNNLPLFLNELTVKEFDYIKSRYDGQGSVKYSESQAGNISERPVKGSTIITTVVEPTDKQIISRCVFINLDDNKMNKKAFDTARKESIKYSQFIIDLVRKIPFPEILAQVDEYRSELSNADVQPRIRDNYALIGGCFEVFRSILKDTHELPDAKKVKEFIIAEMEKTEGKLNPLIYFIKELERLADQPSAKHYIVQDESYLFFNFNGIWSIIKPAYKKRNFPFMTDAYIKELLKKSIYIAHYGDDITADHSSDHGKAVCGYPKKVGGTTRRCFVLLKDKLPGYYL